MDSDSFDEPAFMEGGGKAVGILVATSSMANLEVNSAVDAGYATRHLKLKFEFEFEFEFEFKLKLVYT